MVATLKRHALVDGNFSAEITQLIATQGKKITCPGGWCWRATTWPRLNRRTCRVEVIEEEELPAGIDPGSLLHHRRCQDQGHGRCPGHHQAGERLGCWWPSPTRPPMWPGGRLDKEAAQRAFTVYMPGRNVPMIPRTLSDELCSLKGRERNTLCARLLIAEDGLLLERPGSSPPCINSHARLTYDDVSDWAEHGKALDIDAGVLAQLPLMKAMTEARIKWRTEHALVFPDRPDYDFELGEDGEVLAIHVEPRRIANRMVEESMIAANICAGRVLGKEVGYGIFNVHTGFDDRGGPWTAPSSCSRPPGPVRGRDRQPLRLLRPATLDEQPGHPLAGRQIRRFQSYALMSAEPGAHYGLGLDATPPGPPHPANTATWSTIAYSRRSSPARPRVSAPAWS